MSKQRRGNRPPGQSYSRNSTTNRPLLAISPQEQAAADARAEFAQVQQARAVNFNEAVNLRKVVEYLLDEVEELLAVHEEDGGGIVDDLKERRHELQERLNATRAFVVHMGLKYLSDIPEDPSDLLEPAARGPSIIAHPPVPDPADGPFN
jgi:hypothetical protein